MTLLRSILPLLLLLTAITATAAEEKQKPWYQVELILFKQPRPAVETSEQWDGWSKKRVPINYEDSLELSYPALKAKAINIEQPINGLKQSLPQQDATLEPVTELQPFTFAPVAEWTLGEIYERLNSSEQYQLLIHTAWVQPGLSKDEAISVHLHEHMALVDDSADVVDNRSKTQLTDTGNEQQNELSREVAPLATSSSAATSYPLEPGYFEQSYNRELNSENAPEESELTQTTFNGTLKVLLSRYLHVEINLDYAPQGFPQELGNSTNEISSVAGSTYSISGDSLPSIVKSENSFSPLYETSTLEKVLAEKEKNQQVVYRMHESRRMRSRVLHYLDHPKIGALIKIVPVEIPQKDIGKS